MFRPTKSTALLVTAFSRTILKSKVDSGSNTFLSLNSGRNIVSRCAITGAITGDSVDFDAAIHFSGKPNSTVMLHPQSNLIVPSLEARFIFQREGR